MRVSLILAMLLPACCPSVDAQEVRVPYGFTCTKDLIPAHSDGKLMRCVNEEMVCYLGRLDTGTAVLSCHPAPAPEAPLPEAEPTPVPDVH